jgi:hypothetical protein
MSANETAEAIIIVIKKIGKWILIALLFVVLGVIILSSYEFINQYYKNKPKIITEINNIKIGEKFSDFMFRNPGFTVAKNPPKRDENETYYENNSVSIGVTVKDDAISDITYICKDTYEYTNVNGILCNVNGDEIFEKYGKDVRVQCLKDKTDKDYLKYRVYDVIKYGIRHHVFSNQVKAFHFISPNTLKDYTGLSWVSCE